MGRTFKDTKKDIKDSADFSASSGASSGAHGTGLAPPAKQLRREIRSTKRNPIDTLAFITPAGARKVRWF